MNNMQNYWLKTCSFDWSVRFYLASDAFSVLQRFPLNAWRYFKKKQEHGSGSCSCCCSDREILLTFIRCCWTGFNCFWISFLQICVFFIILSFRFHHFWRVTLISPFTVENNQKKSCMCSMSQSSALIYDLKLFYLQGLILSNLRQPKRKIQTFSSLTLQWMLPDWSSGF